MFPWVVVVSLKCVFLTISQKSIWNYKLQVKSLLHSGLQHVHEWFNTPTVWKYTTVEIVELWLLFILIVQEGASIRFHLLFNLYAKIGLAIFWIFKRISTLLYFSLQWIWCTILRTIHHIILWVLCKFQVKRVCLGLCTWWIFYQFCSVMNDVMLPVLKRMLILLTHFWKNLNHCHGQILLLVQMAGVNQKLKMENMNHNKMWWSLSH